ncbi:hypothetical protein ABH15_11705 [Methanoculleus taiwanensis]|uniref:Uncharacterized protein n=1 Tax=Methanoculleus taiwanensis TaxID=1550565 RepID=A0A498GZ85_9EURY|nr:hypothetical protein [Methanoculleus taiwanensis]RXE55405.1 hypothetical protein ABH15_11705 [Methanoculleus taiwanensis]
MVKREIAIGLAVLLLIAIGTTLLPAGYPQEDGDVFERMEVANPYCLWDVSTITSAVALPEYPRQLMVYLVVDTAVSKDDALKAAEKFGMTGPLEEDALAYYVTGDPYTFEIEKKTGDMAYIWDGRCGGADPRDCPENLPTDEECRKIAEAFLTSHDLMPEGAVFSSVSQGSKRIFSNHSGDTPIATYEDRDVLFTDTLSGFPVVGSGIRVTIGGGGDILEVSRHWCGVEPYREFAILSPEEALEELRETGIFTTVSFPKKAIANEIRLCYYTAPPGPGQPYLTPTYYLYGTAIGDKGTGIFCQYVPAVPELGKSL